MRRRRLVWLTVGFLVLRRLLGALRVGPKPERWVGTVRRECLDDLVIVGPRHLARVLDACVEHYNTHRPPRSLSLLPPQPRSTPPETLPASLGHISRHDILGGLIHEYDLVA
jgi:putative transposase